MANTYKKVYLHIIFAVKGREALISKSWREIFFRYISGIIKNKGHFSLAVNGHHDHVHMLIDYNMNELVPDLVREIKKSSSKYVKENKLSPFHFEWQAGYGAFSVGWQELPVVSQYIKNQEEHHKSRSFKDEYLSLLNQFEIEYKNEYIFDFIPNDV